ncbi:hypothetical protein EX30DRAFT_221516 [Ascodesmis nigricans]|uniref:Uncharacterized protein n=1 Tax=Ascodesmis nigricans TaxID=341454 RepID=A0A4S2N047_9PEZI|nr:hypothetical protein EX30DRAFT_221516 [Ascodesmis nigricans]
MAPRPFSTTIRSRAGRRTPAAGPPKPSIYAVHSGPQRGVHLLSPDPPPRELQYRYRHPINHHPTFLTFSGDFLRRRFDSIDEAVKWIDERDREEELVRSLEDATIGNGKGPVWRLSPPSSPSSSAALGGELAAAVEGGEVKMELERLPRRDKERKQWKEPVFGMRAQGVGKRRWEEREKEKVCCVRAKVVEELGEMEVEEEL